MSREYQLTCQLCNQGFESKRPHTKWCSTKCSKKVSYEKNKFKIRKICKFCNKEFGTYKNKIELCSQACVNKFSANSDIKINCGFCKKEFIVKYKDRDRKYCSQSCAGKINTAEGLTGFKSWDTTGENNPMFGNPAWTKGLTKETDPRLQKIGGKISVTLKQKFVDGEMSNAGENNPMFGKNHSKKTKEQISKTRSKNWVNGDYKNSFAKGIYYSNKMNKEFYYRSNWELITIEYLEKNSEILNFDIEPCFIPYEFKNIQKNYIPDVYIKTKKEEKIIEIKPSVFLTHLINQYKFKAAREYCKQRGWLFEVWTEAKIAEIVKKSV